jgi:general secretion pathway protein A
MYNKFFHFRERPFKLVPNPEYYYLSRGHEEAMAHLTYALGQGDGFVAITGEVGTGKTTLCRVFLENLDERTEVAYIFNPRLGPLHLLKAILAEFGIDCRSEDPHDLTEALNDYLIRMKTAGRSVVVLIDEAQNLSKKVLEQLRLLSNLETNRSKLMQIILVGQPELGEMLDSRELRQLGQRITLSCHLAPLTCREMQEYIEHRIEIATGGQPTAFFTRGAYRQIFRYSAGIPRLINILCDRALLVAYSRNRKNVNDRVVRAAIRELAGRGEMKPSILQAAKAPAAAAAAACAAALALFLFYRQAPLGPVEIVSRIVDSSRTAQVAETPAVSASVNPVATAPSTAAPALQSAAESMAEFLREMDVRAARNLALQSVIELWGVEADIDPFFDGLEDDYDFFQAAAEPHGLSVIRVGCNFQLLRLLNLPAVVAVKMPEGSSTGFLTLRRIDDAYITLDRARANHSITVTEDLLQSYCAGAVYVPYFNFTGNQGAVPRQGAHESVALLKRHLREIGFTEIDGSPYYDETTARAVKAVQRKHGLRPDGIAGPLTKIVLYNEVAALDIPHIRSEAKQP